MGVLTHKRPIFNNHISNWSIIVIDWTSEMVSFCDCQACGYHNSSSPAWSVWRDCAWSTSLQQPRRAVQQPRPGWCTFFFVKIEIQPHCWHDSSTVQQLSHAQLRMCLIDDYCCYHVTRGSNHISFFPSDIRSSVMGQYRTDTDAMDQNGTSLVFRVQI